MKEKIARYFEQEMNYLRAGLNGEDDLIRRNEMAWYCIQRGLGAIQFAQSLGLPFEIAEPMFEDFKARVWEASEK